MARPPAPVAALLAAVVAAGAILAGWASAPTLSELLCLIIATLMAGLAAWWGESSFKKMTFGDLFNNGIVLNWS